MKWSFRTSLNLYFGLSVVVVVFVLFVVVVVSCFVCCCCCCFQLLLNTFSPVNPVKQFYFLLSCVLCCRMAYWVVT